MIHRTLVSPQFNPCQCCIMLRRRNGSVQQDFWRVFALWPGSGRVLHPLSTSLSGEILMAEHRFSPWRCRGLKIKSHSTFDRVKNETSYLTFKSDYLQIGTAPGHVRACARHQFIGSDGRCGGRCSGGGWWKRWVGKTAKTLCRNGWLSFGGDMCGTPENASPQRRSLTHGEVC